jgi:hypothetical protein
MTSNVFDLDSRDMTYGSKLVHAKCKTKCDGDGQPNGLLHWLVVHGVVAYCHLDWQVEK